MRNYKCPRSGIEYIRWLERESEFDHNRYIGKKFDSNLCGKFIVLGVYEYEGYYKNYQKKYLIQFENTGYITDVYNTSIISGSIKDLYYPSVSGVGYLGSVDMDINRKFHGIWHMMLNRCYDENNVAYSRYGGSGILVSDRWLNFTNFVKDIKTLDGYDEYKFENNILELDKDSKWNGGSKIYSKSKCVWIDRKENIKISNIQNNNITKITHVVYDFELYHYNVTELFNLLSSIASIKMNRRGIDYSLQKQTPYKGFEFSIVDNFPSDWDYYNCHNRVKNIISKHDFKYNEIDMRDNLKIICPNTNNIFYRAIKLEYRKMDSIGKIYESNNSGKWKVIGYSAKKNKDESRRYICRNLQSRTVKTCLISNLVRGNMGDKFYKKG